MAKKLAEIGNKSYGVTYTGGPTRPKAMPGPKTGKPTPTQTKKFVGTPKTTLNQSNPMNSGLSKPKPKSGSLNIKMKDINAGRKPKPSGKAAPTQSGSIHKMVRDAKPKAKPNTGYPIYKK